MPPVPVASRSCLHYNAFIMTSLFYPPCQVHSTLFLDPDTPLHKFYSSDTQLRLRFVLYFLSTVFFYWNFYFLKLL